MFINYQLLLLLLLLLVCGRCVSDQVERLINISSSIKDVILPRYTILIITNETDINLISHQISVAQVSN